MTPDPETSVSNGVLRQKWCDVLELWCWFVTFAPIVAIAADAARGGPGILVLGVLVVAGPVAALVVLGLWRGLSHFIPVTVPPSWGWPMSLKGMLDPGDVENDPEARACAEELREMTQLPDDLTRELPDGFSFYLQLMSTFMPIVDLVSDSRIAAPLTRRIERAADLHLTEGPMPSPITDSHFMCWSNFDCHVGASRESLGSCALACLRVTQGSGPVTELVETLVASRMGLFVQEARRGDLVTLRELVTNHRLETVCATGYQGEKGEIWFTRILPSPFPNDATAVVFGTPYVFRCADETAWLDYLERQLAREAHRFPPRVPR